MRPDLPSRSVHSEVGACGQCHLETAAEFRASSMYRSHASPAFRAFFRLAESDLGPERAAQCLDCHGGSRHRRTIEGISCQTCHLAQALVENDDGSTTFAYGVTVTGPEPSGEPKHEYEAKAFFEQASVCAPCHAAPHQPSAIRRSTTFESWSKTRMAKTGLDCLGCHMEGGSHTFVGGNNDLWAGEALDLSLVRGPEGTALHIENVAAGHDFPSDATDLRELEVRALWKAGQRTIRQESLASFGACYLDEHGRPVPFWRARSTRCQLLSYDTPTQLPVEPPIKATSLVVQVVYHRISKRLAWILPNPSSLRSRSSVIAERTLSLTVANTPGATSEQN